jgi:hypothetical protein
MCSCSKVEMALVICAFKRCNNHNIAFRLGAAIFYIMYLLWNHGWQTFSWSVDWAWRAKKKDYAESQIFLFAFKL